MTIPELRQHVARLSPDGPHTEALQHAVRARFKKRDVWYRTQKEHWTGWLRNYDGLGYYGRLRWDRDAQFVYNHVQCAPMLLWLAEAAGAPLEKVAEASMAPSLLAQGYPARWARYGLCYCGEGRGGVDPLVACCGGQCFGTA